MGQVIDFQSSLDTQAQEIMDQILDLPEERFIQVLRNGRDEFLSQGKEEEAKAFVEIGVQLRAKKLLERIES